MDALDSFPVGVVFCDRTEADAWARIVPDACIHTSEYDDVFAKIVQRQRALDAAIRIGKVESNRRPFLLIIDDNTYWKPHLIRCELDLLGITTLRTSSWAKGVYGRTLFDAARQVLYKGCPEIDR